MFIVNFNIAYSVVYVNRKLMFIVDFFIMVIYFALSKSNPILKEILYSLFSFKMTEFYKSIVIVRRTTTKNLLLNDAEF